MQPIPPFEGIDRAYLVAQDYIEVDILIRNLADIETKLAWN